MKQILSGIIVCLSFASFGQNAGSTTELMSYAGGEFVGSCLVRFTRESGEEIIFWNPDFGDFGDVNNPCYIANAYADYMFEITFEMGEVEVDMQGVGPTVIQTEVITKMVLIE